MTAHTHTHQYHGQLLVHAHEGGEEEHGYYDHPEDAKPEADSTKIWVLVTESGTVTSVHATRIQAVEALRIAFAPEMDPADAETSDAIEDHIIESGEWYSIDAHDLPERG
jgi:hypothetical protein